MTEEKREERDVTGATGNEDDRHAAQRFEARGEKQRSAPVVGLLSADGLPRGAAAEQKLPSLRGGLLLLLGAFPAFLRRLRRVRHRREWAMRMRMQMENETLDGAR